MLRDLGFNSSELERDRVKVERCLRTLQTDAALLPAERNLRRKYYTHWQNKLRFNLVTKHGAVKDHEKPLRSPLNRVKISDDSWKVITPHALMHAVMTIREDFEKISDFQWRFFQRLCRRDLRQLAAGQTESAAFRTHFDNCAAKLAEGISQYIFPRFLEQSLNQNGLIGAEVEWAALQVTDLIELQDRVVEHWIKSACDSNPTDCAGGLDFILWANWRAPKWLWMQPNGPRPYDALTAWEQMNEAETRKALTHLRENRWICSLKSTVDQLVGSSHEVLAKHQKVVQGRHNGSAGQPSTRNSENNSETVHNRRRASDKMNDPAAYPEMNAREVMVALELSKSAVYEHKGLERVATGTRAVRFSTKSVVALKNSPPE